MARTRLLFLYVVMLAFGSALGAPRAARAAEDEGAWQQVMDKNGIRVDQRAVPNSKLIEFRSTAHMPASLFDVSAVLWDANRACEWMAKCAQAFFIEKLTKGESVIYNRIKTGAFLDDRDVVVRSAVTMYPAKKAVKFAFHNVDDSRKQPTKGVVRMPRLDGSFTVSVLGPHEAEVVYQIISDPDAGSLPAFIVNRFARDLPFDTQENLRKQVTKDGYEVAHKDLLKQLDWTGFELPGASPNPAPAPGAAPH